MFKKITKTLGLLSLLTLFTVLTCVAVSAKPRVNTDYTWEFTYCPKSETDNNWAQMIENATNKTKVKKLRSSNTKVLTVNWNKESYDMIGIHLKKPGKAYISGVLYEGGKKIGSFKAKVVVRRYICPIKSFKLNKKEFASSLKKSDSCHYSINKTKKFKVKVKPKKGWELLSITYMYGNNKDKAIKNGSTIKCGKSSINVQAGLYNSKLDRYSNVRIDFWYNQ